MSLCNITNEGKLLFGHGGSDNFLLLKTTNEENRIFKIFPVYKNKLKLDSVQYNKKIINNEINIHNILTKHILKKNISPHIVELKKLAYCKKYPKEFFKDCKTYQDYIQDTNDRSNPEKKHIQQRQCYPSTQHYNKLYKEFYITELEFCKKELSDVIKNIFKKSLDSNSKFFINDRYIRSYIISDIFYYKSNSKEVSSI